MFELGNSLREARVRQGLGYPEVELATKIRAKYIRALEEEDFSILPGDTYVRGFLRAYADHLGLDGQLYVDEYGSRFGTSWRDELPPQRTRPPSRRRTVERRGVVLALAGIALVTVLVFVAWRFGGVSPSTSSPSVVQTQQRPRTQPAAPDELVLRGVGAGTYVEVRRGSRSGKVVLQATVPGGGVEKLAGTRFYLFVRSSSALRVRLGGKPVSLPARKNLRVVVTPERTIRLAG
ncbi:MAG TPA: helix-turn-helix domain-containing protein [Gaiellaceae bacterium]|nr:helix-turn-helix domain-containing protein [Gaiellaceae bacterium]